MALPSIGGPAARVLATYLAARVLPALASMLLTLLCIHALAAEAYGVYSLTLLPATLAATLAGGLTGQALLRYGHELMPRDLRIGLIALPLASAALVVPAVAAWLGWSVGWHAGTAAALLLVPLITLVDTRRNLFVARAAARSVLAMDGLRAAAALAVTAALFAVVPALPAVPLAAQCLAAALCLALVRPGPPPADASPRLRRVDRGYVLYGLWFAGWMAALGALSLAERAIVDAASGLAASGRYAAQADVVNAVFSATAGALASALMPRYLAASRGAVLAPWKRLLRIGLAGTAVAAVACLGVGVLLAAFGRGRIAEALVGDPATALLLVAAGAVWTAAGFVQKPLELAGRTRSTFLAVGAALALFLIVAPSLARSHGPAGVAAARLLAGAAFVAATAWATRRLRMQVGA